MDVEGYLDAEDGNLVLVLKSDKPCRKVVLDLFGAWRRGPVRDKDEEFLFSHGVELGVQAREGNRKREKDIGSHDRIVSERSGEFPVVDVKGDWEVGGGRKLVQVFSFAADPDVGETKGNGDHDQTEEAARDGNRDAEQGGEGHEEIFGPIDDLVFILTALCFFQFVGWWIDASNSWASIP